jgi:tetratricopeptide (TPR) repeat protein
MPSSLPRRFIVLLILPGLLAAAPALAQGRRGQSYAFLVGCSAYDRKELRPLQYTRNDILSFHQALLDAGFRKDNVVLMHDGKGQDRDYLPEARKIRKQFHLLLAGLRPGDTVIVALSGHGIRFKGESQAYFCPVDAELTDRNTLIPLDWLYHELQGCKADRKLLLVDACRNEPQSALGKSRAEVDLEKLTRLQEQAVPRGIVALFSCSDGQVSFEDPELKHGVFFHHVLRGWKGAAADSRGRVTLQSLVSYVLEKTTRYARLHLKAVQVPQQKGEFSGVWLLHEVNTALLHFRQGTRAFAKKDYGEAISWFNRALRADPRFASACYWRGKAYGEQFRWDRAIASQTSAIRCDPKSARAYAHRALGYNIQEKYSRALADANEALRLDPRCALAHATRGAALIGLKKFRRGIEENTRALRLDPNLALAYSDRAWGYNELGQYDRAIADCRRALRRDPGLTWAYSHMAWAYNEKKQYDNALRASTEAIRRAPANPFPYNHRGNAYYFKGQYNQAIADYTRAVQLHPKYAWAYWNRSGAYDKLGDAARARADYDRALQLDPSLRRQ